MTKSNPHTGGKKKVLKIPKDYFKDCKWEIEFDWELYYAIQMLVEVERIFKTKKILTNPKP